jgi:beta-glucosidase
MSLPGHLDALIAAVAAANPHTVVVMQSGTPVEMPWIKSVAGLVQAWYGGNEGGNGIADVLFGDVNPSGRLPLSFPVKVQDNPAFLNYRSERGRVLYGEEIYIGYRYYEALEKAVLFPFGHGLSYTSFAFSDLSVTNDGSNLTVSVTVKNTGKLPGAEVVQVYVTQKSPSIRRPVKELKGFAKADLDAGKQTTVKVTIPTKYATSFWDEGRDLWISEKDTYSVIASNSSAKDATAQATGTFEVKDTTWWSGL